MSVMKVLNSSEISPDVMKVAPAVEEIFQRFVSGTKAIQGKRLKFVGIGKTTDMPQYCLTHTTACRKIQGVQEEHAITLSRPGASPVSRD